MSNLTMWVSIASILSILIVWVWFAIIAYLRLNKINLEGKERILQN
jgi:hypothetical protein